MVKDRDGRYVNRSAATGQFISQGDKRRPGEPASVFRTYRLPKDTTVVRLREDVHERGLEAARESLRTRPREGSK